MSRPALSTIQSDNAVMMLIQDTDRVSKLVRTDPLAVLQRWVPHLQTRLSYLQTDRRALDHQPCSLTPVALDIVRSRAVVFFFCVVVRTWLQMHLHNIVAAATDAAGQQK